MRRRMVLITVGLAGVVALALGGVALGGGSGLIFDDGQYVQPGSLDDGKELLPQTKITLKEAVAAAQAAALGQLGQVDLEHAGDRIVYMVDVGDREVRVDSADGSIVSVSPQS